MVMKTQIKILPPADNATTWRTSAETVIILYESKNKDGKGKTQTTTIKKQNKTQKRYLEKVRSAVKIRIILERKSVDLKRKICSKC